VKVGGEQINQYASAGEPGVSTTGSIYRLGAQKEFLPDWFLGDSLGAGTTWSNEGSGSSSQGQTYDGSIAAKHQVGSWLFAGSVAIASASYRNDRAADNTILQSDSNAFMVGGRLRAAYDIVFKGCM
jgi:hypothetical protein